MSMELLMFCWFGWVSSYSQPDRPENQVFADELCKKKHHVILLFSAGRLLEADYLGLYLNSVLKL